MKCKSAGPAKIVSVSGVTYCNMNPESYLPSFLGSCYLFTLLFLCPLVRKEISECFDFLVGFQSVGLDGPGVAPKFIEDHLFAT